MHPRKPRQYSLQGRTIKVVFCHSLPHVVEVREDESLVDIKATGNDVLSIFHSEAMAVFQC